MEFNLNFGPKIRNCANKKERLTTTIKFMSQDNGIIKTVQKLRIVTVPALY